MNLSRFSLDHFQGSLVGGAIGDALGAPLEFLSSDKIFQSYGRNGIESFVEFKDGIGKITDDTQMTLFTAEAIIRSYVRARSKGIWGAQIHFAHQSYLGWLYTQGASEKHDDPSLKTSWLLRQQGLYDVRSPGNTCLSALKSGECGTIDKPLNNSKGCGGVMRVAPVGLLIYKQPQTAFKIASEMAAITHGHPSGYLSAGAFAAILSFLVQGKDLQNAIGCGMDILAEYSGNEETTNAINKALDMYTAGKQPSSDNVERLGAGWVAEEAISIALYCSLCSQNDYKSGVLLSIHHSGDSDSTGAITGNLLGLITGMSKIPQQWKNSLDLFELVSLVAMDLFNSASDIENDDLYARYTPWPKP